MTNTVEAEEFRLVDSKGQLRARLGMDGDSVSLSLHGAQGILQVDIRVDPLGCHVLLAGLTKQQSYLFLKNTGASGLVLTNAAGARQAHLTLSPEGRADLRVEKATGTTGGDSGSP
jgi:hypothetical protein